ncbi:MAG: hypothetical protein SLRJCFUN_001108 [Candidatus Fervidibacter sp.]|jgi:transposase
MALISLELAAKRFGVSTQTIEKWAQQGLLSIHSRQSSTTKEERGGLAMRERLVDEDELADVVESLGWLQLSAEGWDDGE